MQKTHYLKTWPEYFSQLCSGVKTFELRKDDRDFEINDFIILKEYIKETNYYTGRAIKAQIIGILRDAQQFGLMPGYCILSLGKCQTKNTLNTNAL